MVYQLPHSLNFSKQRQRKKKSNKERDQESTTETKVDGKHTLYCINIVEIEIKERPSTVLLNSVKKGGRDIVHSVLWTIVSIKIKNHLNARIMVS